MKTIDLHIHTNCSDGAHSPFEVLDISKQYELSAISIADHDTISAYTESLFTYADDLEIELIPAVEISTLDNEGRKYHILGYGIDLTSILLNEKFDQLNQDRINNAIEVAKLLEKDKWTIDIENILSKGATLTKGTIGRAVVKHPQNITSLKELFGYQPTEDEFVEKFLIKDKKYYVKYPNKIQAVEAIELIHNSGGIAIHAHPFGNIHKGDKIEDLIDRLTNWGIDGFEAIAVGFDTAEEGKEIEYRKEIEEICIKRNLIVTGGSDFHSRDPKVADKYVDVGFHNHRWSIPYSILENLKKHMN